MDIQVRRKIERNFYQNEENRRIACEFIKDQYHSGMTARFDRVGHSSVISDPTCEKAIRVAEGNQAAQWVRVVDNTLTTFRWGVENSIIQLRYFQGWKDIKTYLFLHLPERTYYFMIENILNVAEQWAVDSGLI